MDLIQLNTIAQYRQFLSGRRVLNNGFTPQEMQKYMARDAMIGMNPDFPVLLYDEKAYYQMCFSAINDEQLSETLATIDRSVVSYVRENSTRGTSAIPLGELLTRSGFSLSQTYNELELKIEEHISAPEDLAGHGLRKKDSWCAEDYIRVLALWREGIPMYELPFLTTADIEAYARAGQLIALEEIASGRIVAAVCFETLLGRSIIRHLVVDKLYRGCGYGSVALRQALAEAKRFGPKAWAWVAETNAASRKTFEKNGFCITPVKMYQYLLRRD